MISGLIAHSIKPSGQPTNCAAELNPSTKVLDFVQFSSGGALYLVDVDGSDLRRGELYVSRSPDGSRIA